MDAPEVRQCLDPNNADAFGATAVAGQGQMAGRWLIAHPEQGGHWAPEAEVAGWTPGVFATAPVAEDQAGV